MKICKGKNNLTMSTKKNEIIQRTESEPLVRHKAKTTDDFEEDVEQLEAEEIENGQKIRKCQFCSKHFLNVFQLQKHLVDTHKIKGEFVEKHLQNGMLTSKFKANNDTPREAVELSPERKESNSIDETPQDFLAGVHEGGKSNKCDICNKTFSQGRWTVNNLKRHKQTVHRNDNFNSQHSCNFCGKSYSRPDYLKKHLLVHSNEESLEQSDDHAAEPFHKIDPAWYSGHFMSDLLDTPGLMSDTLDVSMSGNTIGSTINTPAKAPQMENDFKPENKKDNLKRHHVKNGQRSMLMSKKPKSEITNNTDEDDVKKNANKNVTTPKNWEKFITEKADQCYYCGNMFKLTEIQAHMKNRHRIYSKTMHGPKKAKNAVHNVAVGNSKEDVSNRSESKNSNNITDKDNIMKQENWAKQTQCYYDGQLFTNLANIKNHMREVHGTYIATMHGPPKGFCPHKCGYASINEALLKKHIEKFHEKKKNMLATEPTARKNDKENTVENVTIAKNLKKFSCHMCKNNFESPMGLKDHIIANHGSLKIYNAYVKHISDSKVEIKENPKEKGGEEKVESFDTSLDCLQEMKKINKEVIPSKGVSLIKSPNVLKNVHEGQKHSGNNSLLKQQQKYDCHFCNRVFRSKEDFHRHLKSTHGDANEYICSICDKQFEFTDELKSHKTKAHQSEKNSKNMAIEITYDQVVNNIKKCNEKVFENTENLSQLKDKRRSSTGGSYYRPGHGSEKEPFWPCGRCDQIFKKSSELQEHFMSNHNFTNSLRRQKHICLFCRLSFNKAYLLQNHISNCKKKLPLPEFLLNLEQKPTKIEKCKICGEVFKEQINLNRHLSEFHHPCTICLDPFKNSALLKEHVSKFHGKNDEEITTKEDIKTKQDSNTGNTTMKNTRENVVVDINVASKNNPNHTINSGGVQITKREIKIFQNFYDHNPYPDAADYKAFSRETGLHENAIIGWFGATRAKDKKLSGKHKMPQSLTSLGPSISVTRLKIPSNFFTNNKSSDLFKNSENHDESQELVAKPDIKIEEKVDKPLEIQDIFNPQTEKTIMNDQTPKSAKSLPTNNLMISDSSTMENLPSQRQSAFPHFLNGGSLNELATESTSNIEDSNNISDQVLDKSVSNKCKTCDFKSDNTVEFQNHQCNTCSICGKHYDGKNGKWNLIRHIRIIHEKVRFQCDFCDKSYAAFNDLKIHMKKKHPNENLVDRQRSRSRSKNENVRNSKPLEIKQELIENISVSVSNKCETCDFKSDNTVEFQNHQCNTCSICGKHYDGKNGKWNLIRHIRIIHEKVRFQCDFCDKTFLEFWNLKVHMKKKHPNENLVDRQRSRSRSKNENVMNSKPLEIKQELIENISESVQVKQEPLENVKIISQNDFQTETNSEIIQEKVEIDSSEKIDNNDGRDGSQQCTFCGRHFKGISWKLDLKHHIKRHEKAKNYNRSIRFDQPKPCDSCGKEFIFSREFEKHILKCNKNKNNSESTQIKPEPVEDVKEISKNDFQTEAKTEMIQEQYKCSYCPKTFSVKRYCQQHEYRVHEFKPENCRYCGEYFDKDSKIRGHLRKVHGKGIAPDEPLHCNYCDKIFTQKFHLRKHIKAFHQDKSQEQEHNPNISNNVSPPKIVATHKTCKYCQKSFRNSIKFNSHVCIGIFATPKPCEFCDKTLSSSKKLKFHITQEHSSENIKSNYFLKNQKIISHDKTKNYNCHLCNKSFKDFVRLKKHKKSDSHLKKKDAKRNPIQDHEKVQKKVPKIENKQPKIIHEEIIIDEFKDCLDDFTEKIFSRPQPCQFCDDYFLNPNDLTSHMCTGRQEAMKESSKMCDICDVCDKSFTNFDTFKSHICEIAEESIVGNFNDSEKDPFIRENKDSYENDESNEDFYYQYKPEEVAHFPIENDLENHEIMSLLFPCDTCDSAFSMKNDLESHKSTSHPLNFLYKMQQCNVCGKEFKTSEDLMTHKAMNHFSDLMENIETSTMSL